MLAPALTTLGIVFGVFSVIAMLAIGEGAGDRGAKQVLGLGATNIIVRSVKLARQLGLDARLQSNSYVLRYGLLRSDLDLLANIPTSDSPSTFPFAESSREVATCSPRWLWRPAGGMHGRLSRVQPPRSGGRQVSSPKQTRPTCSTWRSSPSEVADELFRFDDPLEEVVPRRRELLHGGRRDEGPRRPAAIGGSLAGQDFNEDVYVPMRTFQVREGDLIMQAACRVRSDRRKKWTQSDYAAGRRRRQVIPTAGRNAQLWPRAPEKHRLCGGRPARTVQQAEQIRKLFNIVLGSIAAISLVVGGIAL